MFYNRAGKKVPDLEQGRVSDLAIFLVGNMNRPQDAGGEACFKEGRTVLVSCL